VLEFKRAILADHGDKPRAERHEVPIDLRLDWPTALGASGFEPTVPTAWLVEGLLIYLSPAEQDLLFERVASLSAPGSRAGIEQMDNFDPETYRAMTDAQSEEGGPDAAAVCWRGGAEWASLIDNEPHSDAVEWFGRRGWTGTATRLTDQLAALGRPASSETPGLLQPSLVSLVTVTGPR
jgi:methyltransferase (TIGR00027 family)